MLRRDTLLVGRVNSKGLHVWGRGCLNEKLEKLYESRSDLFHVYRTKIYLLACVETNDIFLDALCNSASGILGAEVVNEGNIPLCTIASFTKYIKNNSVCVGQVRDGKVLWIEDTWVLGMSQKTLLEQWSRDTSFFEVWGNKVYYIKPKQEIVEDLYFKCVDIAGSELRLAKSLARDLYEDKDKRSYRKEMMRNIAAFRRFSFSQRETFNRYVGLFTQYLSDHDMPTSGLFTPTVARG